MNKLKKKFRQRDSIKNGKTKHEILKVIEDEMLHDPLWMRADLIDSLSLESIHPDDERRFIERAHRRCYVFLGDGHYMLPYHGKLDFTPTSKGINHSQ